jgi:two-component system chemotaxis response regulator CheY
VDKKRVLIVDDSVVFARLLQKIIEDTGSLEVVGYGKNGREGIKLYDTLKPDLVCMDLAMPEMDGLEAIRNIMKLDGQANIVVVSSFSGAGSKVSEAIKLGARNSITKPFETEKVIEILRAL